MKFTIEPAKFGGINKMLMIDLLDFTLLLHEIA